MNANLSTPLEILIEHSESIGKCYFNIDGSLFEPSEFFQRLTGFQIDEFKNGKVNWWAMTPDEWREQDIGIIDRLRKSPEPITYLKEIVAHSGKVIPISITMMLLQCEPYDGLFLVQDMSELFDAQQEADDDISEVRKKAEQLLKARNEAVHSDQMKSNFLANMSHEIRTPLGAILGFTDLLADKDLKGSEREEYLRIIARNGCSLSRIVDDILDLSKVEAGMLALENSPFHPAMLVAETVALFQELARAKALRLVCEAESLPEAISSDPNRIRQIVSNLVSNAIKFTESGCVHVKCSIEENALTVRVRDSGVGLEPLAMAKLFQPFAQANDSMSRKVGGTGLGLHLSKKLAEALGGSLSIESSILGEGSCFKLSLPFAESETLVVNDSTEVCWLDAPSADLTGKQILIVDDSRDNRTLIERILTKHGASVESAADGEAGVELALNSNHDLILMDLQMPEIDGFEATQRLRMAGLTTPIVALTAHVVEDIRTRCKEVGCTAFLTKPVNAKSLVQMIRDLTERLPHAETVSNSYAHH